MYLDSAIIVKLLTDEDDTGFFQRALVGQLLGSSELSQPEVFSALLCKERTKRISRSQRAKAWALFNERVALKQIEILPLELGAFGMARNILEACHPHVALRTLDAIHLAACDLSQDFPLCTTDRRMREAAEILKIPLFPEVLPLA
ncbi:MAG: type II toxin-antitoxin system VapC family toxin [Terrimicrobiaceae bacterium]